MHDSETAQSFSVRVNDEEWKEVPSLAQAGPDDQVFIIDSSTCTVIFGDGKAGGRPSADALVTITYRAGGGEAGNAHVSITTTWPPRESRYTVALAATGVRI